MDIRGLAALACVVAAMVLGAPQARAQEGAWLRAETENFVVYSRGRERPLRAAVQRLEHFNDLLHDLTGAARPETPVRLSVYLLQDQRALRVVFPEAHAHLRGFYTYQPEAVAAFAVYDDAGWEGGAQQVLFHEYTHHFMMQYFRAAYPPWYVEGFAEYLSTVAFEHGRTVVGRASAARATTLVGNRTRLLPTRVMLGAMPEDAEARDMFYAQSWLMVHFLFSQPERQQAFEAYIRALGEGQEHVQAFEAAFGVSGDEFQSMLADYMRGSIPYTTYPSRDLAESTITITRMPASADSLLLLNARMQHTASDDSQLIDQVVQEASRYPADAYAVRSAAYAEMRRSPPRARELVLPLIEANAEDFEAQYIAGRSFLLELESGAADDAVASQARRHFVRAFRANPTHVPTLYYYVRSHFDWPLPDTVLDVLIQAHLLAPQVDEIRFNLAMQLLSARRFEEAATLLAPIAYSPHGGEGAEQARRYLEAARRGEMPQP